MKLNHKKKFRLFFFFSFFLSFCSNILSSFLSRNAYAYTFFPTLLLCKAAQHVQISSKNGNREIQREEKRKIITVLGWLSELKDLTVARFHHKIHNLKWHPVYPAVLKQLLLKITSVYFFQLYTCVWVKDMPGSCSLWFSQYMGWPRCAAEGLFGTSMPFRLLMVCIHIHPTHSVPAGMWMANLAGEGALRVQRKFWKILKVSAVGEKGSACKIY